MGYLRAPSDGPMPPERCGGKAAGLARLAAAGFPVPPFLCLTVDAFRDHLAALPPGAGPPQILGTPAPEGVRAALAEAFRALGSRPLAVRSSAAAEDRPGRSLAGRYATLLGIADPASLERAVKECWASLGPDGGAMAVVLQALVPADEAGVIFTAEPMTRRRDRVIVESVRGRGEALASGRAAPDRRVFRVPGLRLLSGTGGPARTARRLARMALAADARLGGPLDLEWARQGEELWLLQARPMTGKAVPPEDLRVWSNLNTAEVLPQVVTPSTWSLARRLQDRMFRRVFAEFGVDVDREPVVGLVAGRVYFNLSAVAGLLRDIPLLTPAQVDALMGGVRADLPEGGIPEFRARPLARAVRFARIFLSILAATPSRVERFRRSYAAEAARLERRDPSALEMPELLRLFREVERRLLADGEVLFRGGAAAGWFELLRRFTKARLGDGDGLLAQRLAAGAGGVESADAGLDLWRLAAGLRGAPAVADVLRENGDPAEWPRRLRGDPSGERFLRAWESLLDRHGHRAALELELAEPRWREAPAPLAGVLRGYLRDLEGTNPFRRLQRAAAEREAAMRGALSRLGNPLVRAGFRLLVRCATSGLRQRENIKAAAMRLFAALRRILLEIGRRYAARGFLDAAEDVFFLTFDEAETLDRDARERVRERRGERDWNAALRPPPVVAGRWDPGDEAGAGTSPGRVLRGIGIFPGVVTATARVLADPGEGGALLPGEVLVAPYTNPGWAPVMVAAAAMVTDTGGFLSHGCIVARELGLPAVVNAAGATRAVRTGQRVRVDGARGVVEILG